MTIDVGLFLLSYEDSKNPLKGIIRKAVSEKDDDTLRDIAKSVCQVFLYGDEKVLSDPYRNNLLELVFDYKDEWRFVLLSNLFNWPDSKTGKRSEEIGNFLLSNKQLIDEVELFIEELKQGGRGKTRTELREISFFDSSNDYKGDVLT